MCWCNNAVFYKANGPRHNNSGSADFNSRSEFDMSFLLDKKIIEPEERTKADILAEEVASLSSP